MSDLRMGAAESRFADIIWDHEPISSGQLAKLAGESLAWKKTTAFTVLKRLCDRGIFQNQGGTVTSLLSREEYYSLHSRQYVNETFGGSLPAFLAAFSAKEKLTDKQINELQRVIDGMRG